MRFKELEQLVIEWGAEKGILTKATPITQFVKTVEEVEELEEALSAQSKGEDTFINKKGIELNTKKEITDSIGDITVTLILQCELQGFNFLECLNHAYNEIKDRKGKMINGTFVKE